MAIVDLSLDGSSGLDLSEIRSRFPTVKSIVFSIHDAELYAPRALRAGAAGFVSKTQPCEDLLVAIRALTEGEIYVAPDVAQRILRRMSSGGRARAEGGVELLSDRELQVFELVGRGQTTGEIAKALHLSPKTVETHRQRIKAKLGIDSGTSLDPRGSSGWRKTPSAPFRGVVANWSGRIPRSLPRTRAPATKPP